MTLHNETFSYNTIGDVFLCPLCFCANADIKELQSTECPCGAWLTRVNNKLICSMEDKMAIEKQYFTMEEHQAAPVSRPAKRFPPDFKLLAQDISSPATICYWIGENIETASPEKLHDALDMAIMMRDYEHRRQAD